MLVSQGVPQNLKPYDTVKLVEPMQVPKVDANGKPVLGPDGKQVIDTVTEQTIAQGPVASQEIIKEFGTNGGGFFNANSAHPFENPTPFTNLIEMFAIFAIGAGLTYTLGRMVGSQRHGWAVWAAMADSVSGGRDYRLLGGGARQSAAARSRHPPARCRPAATWRERKSASASPNSALWATVTTDTSCGAVNSMHDSFTPLGGMVPLANMMLSEVVFGGVGSGMYGMIIFIILAVFIAGLMVGRTPEYLGKKIEAYDVKMAMLVALDLPADHSDLHRHFGRCGRSALQHLQSRAARIFRDPLRLHRRRRQQRFGVRRTERQHALVQHLDRHRHADRAVFS